MILVIDASNIRQGGGVTHLREILKNGHPGKFGFRKVVVWSNKKTLSALPDKSWLIKETHPLLNKSFIWSFYFQLFFLTRLSKLKYDAEILFVPGGTFFGSFRPYVTMSQNMLPFELSEAFRFKSISSKIKFILLRFTQKYTFKNSDGLIFLTNYAKDVIVPSQGLLSNSTLIIPHGINPHFLNFPKLQKNISLYDNVNPFKLLYVSIVTAYKHQWNVSEAVLKLRDEGFPVELDLVGPFTSESLKRLKKVLSRSENNGDFIKYLGPIDYDNLASIYSEADAFVFASSCENMPIILVEAMTAGLPIVSSKMGPMPEVLGDAGFYFNPLDVESIYKSLKEMLLNSELRSKYANESYLKSINYTWESCSDSTFKYIYKIAKEKHDN